MNNSAASFPTMAKVLGYGGVIPFVVLALAVVANVDLSAYVVRDAVSSLLVYAAVIVSFIGAVHWGIALKSSPEQQNSLFFYSVLPALLAWVWLVFFPQRSALFGMALTIPVLYFIDRGLLTENVMADYLKLRLHLTVIVTICLFLAAFRGG